jgi:hypothetical protein
MTNDDVDQEPRTRVCKSSQLGLKLELGLELGSRLGLGLGLGLGL